MKQKEMFTVITAEDVCILKHALNHYLLDDEGKRVVVSGMFVTKVINRNKKTKLIRYWLYDSDDVFITSGSPGECSKPIAWMPFPEPLEATK